MSQSAKLALVQAGATTWSGFHEQMRYSLGRAVARGSLQERGFALKLAEGHDMRQGLQAVDRATSPSSPATVYSLP